MKKDNTIILEQDTDGVFKPVKTVQVKKPNQSHRHIRQYYSRPRIIHTPLTDLIEGFDLGLEIVQKMQRVFNGYSRR